MHITSQGNVRPVSVTAPTDLGIAVSTKGEFGYWSVSPAGRATCEGCFGGLGDVFSAEWEEGVGRVVFDRGKNMKEVCTAQHCADSEALTDFVFEGQWSSAPLQYQASPFDKSHHPERLTPLAFTIPPSPVSNNS